MTLSHSQHLPILQALIVNKAPKHIINSTIDHFAESINTTDSFGRYPIDVAVRHGLAWDSGMKDIAEAFASSQQTMILNVCAKHGIQWENGTKEVLQTCVANHLEREDDRTGLYPFMVAAVGGEYEYDLDTIFHMIQASPLLVQKRSK